ncbi:MAG TPA: TIGR03435 family protein [Terracidiphilus sp.]|nr:TIGR03435 family protein [Terracidiphilus sp.]
MLFRRPTILLVFLGAVAFAQSPPPASSFEAASVRPSQHEVGPDYNNQITYSPAGFNGKNVTLKRLIAEAWNCQLNQVSGPPWLDHNEYDIAARAFEGATREQMQPMLRALLVDRFGLKQHSESKLMRVYELEIVKNGPKIKPVQDASASSSGPGLRFRGGMRQFADLLAIQFTIPAPENPGVPVKAGGPAIPVLDKTGLQGIYDFSVELPPELGTDIFTAWKRALEDQLGLKIESRMDHVAVVVVDDATRIPAAN